MKNFLWIIFFCICICFSLKASPATEAASDFKGFFGESLVADIYQHAGRKLVPYKVNPNLHGPDLIFQTPSGFLEIHEVKAYTNWAGKTAMHTTTGGTPTYELSKRWLNDWINKTLANPATSGAEKSAARVVSEAIKNNRINLIYDEVNLTTQQLRVSSVIQQGADEVTLIAKTGTLNLKRFNQYFSKKSKDFLEMKMGNIDKLMNAPKVHPSWQPISKKDQLKLLPKDAQKNAGVERIEIHNALMTANGKLLIAVKHGVKTGLMVFAFDAGHAVYEYSRGEILRPELERMIADAAVKGIFVGTCVGVTVFLGATPTGWCVLAVSIGSYFIVDQALKIWHRYQDSKYLTIDDLQAWGIESDTVLEQNDDTVLKPQPDTLLESQPDTLLSFY